MSLDDKAATWDDEAKIERARAVADAIAGAVPLEPSMRLFEYGAGTGLVAEQLASRVGPITLADPSAGMREVASEKVAAGSLPPPPGCGAPTSPPTGCPRTASS